LVTAFELVTLLITQLFTLISGIIFPATSTPISTLAAFGLLFPLVVLGLNFVLKLARGSGG
jgi:hypothetical protein